MHPARIIGRVVANAMYPAMKGLKLILLQPSDWEGNPLDDYVVAADAVSAGSEEFVFYVESMEAAVAFEEKPPIDASIVAVIDGVNLDGEFYNKG